MDGEGEGEHSRTGQERNKLLCVYRVVIGIKRSNTLHKYLGLLLNSKSLSGRTYLLSPRFLPTLNAFDVDSGEKAEAQVLNLWIPIKQKAKISRQQLQKQSNCMEKPKRLGKICNKARGPATVADSQRESAREEEGSQWAATAKLRSSNSRGWAQVRAGAGRCRQVRWATAVAVAAAVAQAAQGSAVCRVQPALRPLPPGRRSNPQDFRGLSSRIPLCLQNCDLLQTGT